MMFERLRERLGRRAGSPLLSVVVPIYNVEEYVDECLQTIRDQAYRNVEIIIVDDGSPDGSREIAERHARSDKRIIIIDRLNGGLSAARNTGVAASNGAYLTFVDSDDTVTINGFASAMQSLRNTGADIAVLKYRRIRNGKIAPAASWIRALHRHERLRVDLAAYPVVMVNASAWSKVFRKDFWDRKQLSFIEGILYEDQPFSTEAYAKARSIDVLTETAYNWRVRETSISQGHASAENLRALLDATFLTFEVLNGLPMARQERAMQKLCYDMMISTLKLERADDEYLDVLIDLLPLIVHEVPRERFLAEVPVQLRVLYELICRGRRKAIWSYVQAEGMQLEMQATGIEPAGFTAYLPGWQHDGLGAEMYVLCEDQTPLKVRVLEISRTSSGDLEVSIEAYIRNVDFTQFLPRIRVSSDDTVCVVARSSHDAVVTSRQQAQRKYMDSGWTVTVENEYRDNAFTVEVQAGPFVRSRRLRIPEDRIPASLSVIVPVFNAEKFLDECLESIRAQHYRDIEIVVIDDGSTDSSLSIAKRHAAEDGRIHLISQLNAGVSVARNAGVAAAQGAYLTFVDADDTVTEDGFASAMLQSSASGSDIVVMPYRRQNGDVFTKPARWIGQLHAVATTGTTLRQRPDIMVNALACAKIFSRKFWEREKLQFRADVIYEDQILTAEAFLLATAIDISTVVAYNWRIQKISISQGQVTAANVSARLQAAEIALGLLASHPFERTERALQLLRYNMRNSTLKLERAGDEYLSVLMEKLPLIVDLVPRARFLAEVPVQFRVLYELICQGKRHAVWAYVQAEGMQIEMQPTGLEAAGFSAYLPGWQRDGLDPETYVLCDDQTPLKVRVLDMSKTASGVLHVSLEAYIQNVNFAQFIPDIRVSLAGAECAVSRSPHAATVTSRQNAERRYADSGWTVSIEAASHMGAATFVLQIDVVAGPFERSRQLRVGPRRPAAV